MRAPAVSTWRTTSRCAASRFARVVLPFAAAGWLVTMTSPKPFRPRRASASAAHG